MDYFKLWLVIGVMNFAFSANYSLIHHAFVYFLQWNFRLQWFIRGCCCCCAWNLNTPSKLHWTLNIKDWVDYMNQYISYNGCPHRFVFSIHYDFLLSQFLCLSHSYVLPLMYFKSSLVFLALFLSLLSSNFLYSLPVC